MTAPAPKFGAVLVDEFQRLDERLFVYTSLRRNVVAMLSANKAEIELCHRELRRINALSSKSRREALPEYQSRARAAYKSRKALELILSHYDSRIKAITENISRKLLELADRL
jgi:hypothetical protein